MERRQERDKAKVRDDEEKTLCSASRLFLTILFLIFVSGFAPATTSAFLFSLTLLSITLSAINLSLSFALLLLSGRKGRPGALSFLPFSHSHFIQTLPLSEHMALTTHDLRPGNSSEKHKET